jgi:hypothetical protein
VPGEAGADVVAGDGGAEAAGPPQLLAAAVTAMISPARTESRIHVMAAPGPRAPGISRYVCAGWRLNVDERSNPENSSGNCRSDEQFAGALGEIAPRLSRGNDILRVTRQES